jgi:carbamoyltransferase
MVLNTSLNDTEPIVCTPIQAIELFMRTQIDILAIEDFIVEK